jgi:hypothetical protein
VDYVHTNIHPADIDLKIQEATSDRAIKTQKPSAGASSFKQDLMASRKIGLAAFCGPPRLLAGYTAFKA